MSSSSAADFSSLFEPIVGADGFWASESQLARFAIHDRRPRCIVQPRTEEQVSAILQVCAREGVAVVPWGAGARQAQLPAPLRYDLALCLRELKGVIAHEAADLTITVQAGGTVAEVERRLAGHGQWLGLEPAYPERTTVGGLVAAAADGPCRARFGRVRDALLGIRFVTGEGKVVRAGGRVVKNVAGYDLMKLLTGSWGTLGVIVAVTLKVWPRAKVRSLWVLRTDSWDEAAEVGDLVEQSSLEPALLAIQSSVGLAPRDASFAPLVAVGFLGAAEEVGAGQQDLQSIVPSGNWTYRLHNDLEAAWNAVRNFPLAALAQAAVGFRCSVLPAEVADLVRSLGPEVSRRGGYLAAWPQSGAVFLRLPPEGGEDLASYYAALRRERIPHRGQVWVDRWHPVLDGKVALARLRESAPRLIELISGVQSTLDPAGILAPGRIGES